MHSVREFVEETLKNAEIDYKIVGKNEYEKFVDVSTGESLVVVDPKFYRPAEVSKLRGDCTMIESELGWERVYDFKSLVAKMYKSDYDLLK